MSAPRVERRLAAILSADVAGFTRLMERDEQGTLERLQVHRKELVEPLVAEHRGRVVNFPGDNALCEFASVVDAVACAVALQEGMAGRERDLPAAERVRFRIGVNLGDVIVEDGAIYGDGVNVAARLEGLAEPGGICVSGKVREELRKRLDLAFAPMGRQRVKNLAEPVEAWRVVRGGVPDARWFRRVPKGARRAAAAASGLVMLMAAGAGGWWWHHSGEAAGPPLPDEPSVVVLPFDNPTGDQRFGRLADGMVENVIADLPRHGVFVVGRGTSFGYRGRARDPRDLGRELGVRYVVEGSLQGDGERLRAVVNLVDAETGGLVWSERYDRQLDDLFAVQDELAEHIVDSIGRAGGAIRRARTEAAHGKPLESLQAFDLMLLGRQAFFRFTREDNARAQDLLRRAVQLDGGLASAHMNLAGTYKQQVEQGWAPRGAAMAGWLAATRRAVELDPDNAWGRYLLARWHATAGDPGPYASELRRAAELVDDSELMFLVGAQLPYVGETARGMRLIERGLRLDPDAVDRYRWAQRDVHFFAGRFEAAAAASEAISDPDGWDALVAALVHAQLGRTADTERWRVRLLEADAGHSAERDFWRYGDFVLPQGATERNLYLGSIVKAGLRVCATAAQIAAEPGMRRLPGCEAERARVAARRS